MPIDVVIEPEATSSILAMILGSGLIVKLVLIILLVLSVVSWAITIAKSLQFRKARSDSLEFTQLFWETRNLTRVGDSASRLGASPLTRLFECGYREISRLLQDLRGGKLDQSDLITVQRALERAEYEESLKLERGVTFLATVASAAPFIGLFGTVWGIMNAFHGLSDAKSSTLQAVAPGISEALVATAIGLAAAIPAAIAYNYFSVTIRRFRESMSKFTQEFINVAERQQA